MKVFLLSIFLILFGSALSFNTSFPIKKLRDIILKKAIKSAPSNLTHPVHPEARLPFVEYCDYYNYPVESHSITTEDGYILTLYRIQRKYSTIQNGLPVVFMQHGLLDCSDGFIINEESRAPAFMLANRGYDVWLGNVRGNKYSRQHSKYDPDQNDEFWQFSFDEMAQYDLPAYFIHVANHTGAQKIDYIGHSQGTIIMFAALSEKNPIVNKYLGKFIALGPVAYVYNQRSTIMSILADSKLDALLKLLDIQEFMETTFFTSEIGEIFCAMFGKLCDDLVASLADADPTRDNYERYDVVAGHDPAGTSTMNMVHWEQLTKINNFQKHDYGTDGNMAKYGQPSPPLYNLGNIEHEVYLFAGMEDYLADPTDVLRLKDELKNSKKVQLFNYPQMGHITFLWGIDMSYMNDVFLTLGH